MRYRISAAFSLVLLAAPAVAQQSDTQQILKLLQDMNGRFDKIEERLEKVEGGAGTDPVPDVSSQPPAASAAPASAPDSTEPPKGIAQPGWRIDVFPLEKKDIGKSAIARTFVPIGKTYFDRHFEGGFVSNQVAYRGQAYFWARTPGEYTFKITLDQSEAERGYFNCKGDLDVEDRNIVPSFFTDVPASSSGNIDLQEGKYAIKYKVWCWTSAGSGSPDAKLNSDYVNRGYKKISYSITVLGPSDMSFREFEPDELFVVVPAQNRSAIEPVPAAPPSAPVPGAVTELAYAAPAVAEQVLAPLTQMFRGAPVNTRGLVTANANFRIGPSKSAPAKFEVPPRTPLFVIEQVGSWYKVRLNSGITGYMHDTVIALQVQ